MFPRSLHETAASQANEIRALILPDAGEGVIFLYCRDIDKGLWYLPGSGIGALSVTGRQMMKEAIAAGP